MNPLMRMPHQVTKPRPTGPMGQASRQAGPLPAALGLLKARYGMGQNPAGGAPGMVPYQQTPFATRRLNPGRSAGLLGRA